MKDRAHVSRSCQEVKAHLDLSFRTGIPALTIGEFVRSWCSFSLLQPGDWAVRDGRWAEELMLVTEEAWRRFEFGKLFYNELCSYQAAKARIGDERESAQLERSWRFENLFVV